METKKCSKCGETKPVEESRKNSRGYGFSSQCNQCRKLLQEYFVEQRKSNLANHAASVKRAGARQRILNKDCLVTLTAEQWQKILVTHKFRCVYCHRLFTKQRPVVQDHFFPLCKGGNHTAENVVPACSKCNAHKGQKVFKSVEEAREFLKNT